MHPALVRRVIPGIPWVGALGWLFLLCGLRKARTVDLGWEESLEGVPCMECLGTV